MSYFMNNGAKVAQAAAGLGGPGFTQAAAGIGAAAFARSGVAPQFCSVSVALYGPFEDWFGVMSMSQLQQLGQQLQAIAAHAGARRGPTFLVRAIRACGQQRETKEFHMPMADRQTVRAVAAQSGLKRAGGGAPTTMHGVGDVGYSQAAVNGLGAVAETPSVIGGDIVNVFRDGIFAEGKEAADYGELTNVFNDGIFGGSIRSGLGAAGGTLDLRSPAVLKQVKMMIRSIDPNLPVSDIDVPWWTVDTENSWHTAVYATAIKTNTPPAAAGTWNQKVGGHDVPTTQGLYAVFGYAVQGVAPNYAQTYWPDLAAWVTGGGTAVRPPSLSEHHGMTTAKMMGFGAAAAGVVLAGLFLLKKKRHGAAAA